MYCRFCGESILSDSEYCPMCGKKLASKTPHKKLVMANRNNENKSTTAGESFKRVVKVCCFIALVFFLIFFVKMAPGFDDMKVLWYIIGAIIAIFFALFFAAKANTKDSKVFYFTAFVISILILVLTVTLRITYEAKVDSALADIPSSGIVNVKLSCTDKYYNLSGEGYVNDPTSYISINGYKIYDNGTMEIPLNTNIYVEGFAKYYFSQQQYNGNGEYTIKLNKDNLKGGYTFDIEFNTGGDHSCIITVKAIYTMDFWHVVLH